MWDYFDFSIVGCTSLTFLVGLNSYLSPNETLSFIRRNLMLYNAKPYFLSINRLSFEPQYLCVIVDDCLSLACLLKRVKLGKNREDYVYI